MNPKFMSPQATDLAVLYEAHRGKVSDKWASYLEYYDALFQPIKNRKVRILEIGIQNGGSLELWSQFFPNAEHIIGCDINEHCSNLVYEDPRISVVVGDANDPAIQASILEICSEFDIIIDDGSHLSSDIVRSFGLYFPRLAEGGLYVAEDLHCSYWGDFEGGIEAPFSSIAFFKRLADYVNREHWGAELPADAPLAYFAKTWNTSFDPVSLRLICEVSFRNSVSVVYKGQFGSNTLGPRVIAGSIAEVEPRVVGLNGVICGTQDEGLNGFGPRSSRLETLAAECTLAKVRAATREAEATSAKDEAARVKAQLREAEENAQKLAGLLADARRRPLKQFKRLIVRRILLALSKASPPLSKRTTKRFALSAEKRDPNRSEIRRERSANSYKNILEEWSRQRLALSKETNDLVQRLSNGPMFSLIVPVFNTDPKLLQETINSIIDQSYVNWELCIADDASTDLRTKEVLRDAVKTDNRIKVVVREKNGHISNASNSAIEIAKGDFLVLVDHDDLLDRDALLYVAEVIDQHPDAKIIYTDEDKIREDGTRYDPHFKPDWNRELLYSVNYVSHLGCYDTQLLKKIGGFRVGLEGAQEHDLLLRCLAHVSDTQIHHIPKVLYSWRASPGSTADTADAKPYAWDAGVRAVSDALTEQHGQEIEVARGPHPFTYIPRWPNDAEPSVTIIIPTRDRLDLTKLTVDSILEKTDYQNFKIIIVDNGSVEPETLAWFEEISLSSRVSVIRDDGPFNYSALNNKAVAQSKADIVALVNNDIEIIAKGWLREMVSLANRPDVGCVGAKLYYLDNRVQHAGVIVGLGHVAGHSHKFADRSDSGYFGRMNLRQEYTAVTGACLVVRRDVYNAVGGLNEEHLAIAFNDVDFCLKVKAAGYRNLWTPLAEMYHHESASRKTEDTPAKEARFKSEIQYMIEMWQADTFKDPAYNPNLTLDHEDFRFGPARW